MESIRDCNDSTPILLYSPERFIASSSFDGLGPLAFSYFRINLKTMDLTESCRTPWTGGSARLEAATYTGQHKHRRNADIHPCPDWNSNPRIQCSRGVIGSF
jgi:hypothetical protein